MTLPEQFNKLAQQWEHATLAASFTNREHPAFKALVAMGSVIAPWVLRRMDNAPTHWMEVLHEAIKTAPILGVPVINEPGVVVHMMEQWRKWGRDNGFL